MARWATSGDASWVIRIPSADGVLIVAFTGAGVAAAGMGVAVAGTGRLAAVVVGLVVLVEAAGICPSAKGNFVVGNGLEQRREKGPSRKRVSIFPGREAGL